MRIRTLTAPKMADALQIIRQQLGPEALILSTRKVTGPNGEATLEITAAVNEPEPPTQSVAVNAPVPATITPQPANPASLEGLLTSHNLAPSIITRITAALPGLQSAGFTQAEALEMLIAKFAPFKSPADLLTPGHAHLFIGPPGAGKTTLIAKIAVQAHGNGRKVGLLSLDDAKIGGFEPLAITAETLGDSAHLLTSAASLKSTAQIMGPRHLLLVDTPGLNPCQPSAATALKNRLAELNIPATCHLVLPADLNGDDMAAFPVAAHHFNPASIAFTRLDCTTRYGALLTTAITAALPVGVAAHSGNFATPPLALTPGWLAGALTTLPRQPWEFTS